jgi:pyridine nucleotide-disulfide oxidoreductase
LFRHQGNVRVRLAEVTGVDAAAREVLLGAARIRFDYLVLATGAQHSYFGQDSWSGNAPGLKSIEDATAIRSRLLRAFEEAENALDEGERAAWLTFVVVGGGPAGVELAGAIAELARHGIPHQVLVEHDAEVAGALPHLVESTAAIAQQVDERHAFGIEQLEGEPHALGRILDPGEGIGDVRQQVLAPAEMPILIAKRNAHLRECIPGLARALRRLGGTPGEGRGGPQGRRLPRRARRDH